MDWMGDKEMSESKRKKRFATNVGGEDGEAQLELAPPQAGVGSDGTPFMAASSKFSTINHLPPELLEQIFKKVSSPADLLNCWNTSSIWSDALRSPHFYFKMTFPFLLPYLNRADLLACSSVSKCWNEAVDAGIQHAEGFGSDSRMNLKQRISLPLVTSKMSLFMEAFSLSTTPPSGDKIENSVAKNRVVFRRVMLWLWFYDRLRQQELFSCLRHFGHLTRHLELHIYDEPHMGPLRKVELIRSCLQLTPNVRVLDITVSPPHPDWDHDLERESELPTVDAHISQHPMPPLHHLQYIKMHHPKSQNEFRSIVQAYAPQLAQLKFNFKLVDAQRTLSLGFERLERIEYLVDSLSSGMDFRALMRSLQCPAKQLTIVIDNPSYMSNENTNCLTIGVNTASASLETLIVRLKGGFDESSWLTSVDSRFDQLRLPLLKRLSWTGFVGYPSIQFLHSVCPALQQLTVAPSFSGNLFRVSGAVRLVQPGPGMYAHLYSEHLFWIRLAQVERVEVDLERVLPPVTADVDWVQIMGHRYWEQARKERKVYYRTEYATQLAKDRAIWN